MQQGAIQWASSEPLVDEIDRNPDVGRRLENNALLALVSESIEINGSIASRATALHLVGYGAYDALHLACAEAAHADVLLTTDDEFMRRASRGHGKPLVAVRNPLLWSKEDYHE